LETQYFPFEGKTVRDKVVTFWTDWKKKKQYFSNVGEWWDTGKSRIKSLLIKCSRTKLIKSKQERARVLKRYRTLVAKDNLSANEVAELDAVKSQLATIDFQRVQGNKIRCKASGSKQMNSLRGSSVKQRKIELSRKLVRLCIRLMGAGLLIRKVL
jgi:hypothetical protein